MLDEFEKMIERYCKNFSLNLSKPFTVEGMGDKFYKIQLFELKGDYIPKYQIQHELINFNTIHENYYLGDNHYIYGEEKGAFAYYQEILRKEVSRKVVNDMISRSSPIEIDKLDMLEEQYKKEFYNSNKRLHGII